MLAVDSLPAAPGRWTLVNFGSDLAQQKRHLVASQHRRVFAQRHVLDFAHAAAPYRPTGQKMPGNSVNFGPWDITEMRSSYDGISTVHSFYEGSQETIARLGWCPGMRAPRPALNAPSGRPLARFHAGVARERGGGLHTFGITVLYANPAWSSTNGSGNVGRLSGM
jgi:hypothetical protein